MIRRPILIALLFAGATCGAIAVYRAHSTAHVSGFPSQASVADLPGLEVGDQFSYPEGSPWHVASNRALIVVTSGTCLVCASGRSFEAKLDSLASSSGIPVYYLISSDPRQDDFAKTLAATGKKVIRGILGKLGVARTPTFLAVNRDSRIVAAAIGVVPTPQENSVVDDLLFGKTPPSYTRINSAELYAYASKEPNYLVLELSGMVQSKFPGGKVPSHTP